MVLKVCIPTLLLVVASAYAQGPGDDLVDTAKAKSSAEILDEEMIRGHGLMMRAEQQLKQAQENVKKDPKKAAEQAARAGMQIAVTPMSDWRVNKANEANRLLDQCAFETLKAKTKTDGTEKIVAYLGKVDATLPKKPELRVMTIRHQGDAPQNAHLMELYLFKDGNLIAKAIFLRIFKRFLVADITPQWYKATKNADLMGCEVWGVTKVAPSPGFKRLTPAQP